MVARSWHGGEPKVASVSFRKGCCGDPIGSFNFSARQRLRTAAEFEHVYKSGQRFSEKLFQITACGNVCGFARLGLSIASRTVGHAVARNRIRRVAREVFRLAQRELPALDVVVSARSAAREASRAELRANLSRLLTTVGERCAGSSRQSSRPIDG
jgi:ribonuclease P protein component